MSRAAWRVRRAAPLFAAGALAAWGIAVAWGPNGSAEAGATEAASTEAASTEAGSRAPVVDAHAEYLHCITAAQQALQTRDLPRAKTLLSECAAPERGWEWDRLAAVVDRSAAVIEVGSPVHALVWSAGAARLVATAEDGRVVAWSVVPAADGGVPRLEPQWTVRVDRPLDDLAIDEVGGVVYGGGEARTISAWRLEDGEEVQGLPGLAREVRTLEIDGERRRIFAGSLEGELVAWDLDTREVAFRTKVDAAIVGSSLSPDADVLLLSHAGGTVGIHDARDGHRRRLLERHTDGVEAAIWTSAGVVSGGWDDRLRRFDPRTGEEGPALGEHDDGIVELVAVADDVIASASRDGTIALWNVRTGAAGRVLRGHDYGVEALAVGEGGHVIASGSLDGTVRLWDLDEDPLDRRLREPHDKVHAVAWGDAGDVLFAAVGPQWGRGDGDALLAWSMPGAEVLARVDDHARTIDAIAVSSDLGRLASGSRDGEVAIRDRATLEPLARARVHEGATRGLAFEPGGAALVSAGEDGVLVWLDVDDAHAIRRVSAGVGALAAVVVPREARVVAVGERGLVRVDAEADPVLWSTEGADPFAALAVVDGEHVLVGTDSGVVTLLDVDTLTPVWTSATFGRGVNDLDVAPDGSRIAVASEDYRVRLLDATTGELALVVGAHASVATSVAFSPKGDAIASGGFDRSVRIWTAPGPRR